MYAYTCYLTIKLIKIYIIEIKCFVNTSINLNYMYNYIHHLMFYIKIILINKLKIKIIQNIYMIYHNFILNIQFF